MKPKIPKGWRKLRAGEIIRPGDRYWSWGNGPWATWDASDDGCDAPYKPIGVWDDYGSHTTIRRIKRKARK